MFRWLRRRRDAHACPVNLFGAHHWVLTGTLSDHLSTHECFHCGAIGVVSS